MNIVALHRRLAKLEATVQPAPAPVADRKPIDFGQIIAEIKAETARVAALPPAQRLAHLRREISAIQRQADAPAPDTPFGEVMHRFYVMDARKGFPNHAFDIRRAEIEILKLHGYDVAELERAHRDIAHIPWQAVHYLAPLPPAAQEIIDIEMFDA